MQVKRIIAVVLVALATMGAAKDCGGKANEAAYAGDGVTQFTDSTGRACGNDTPFCSGPGQPGKLQFGKSYKAVAVDTTDRQNCEWSVYTINAEGKTTVVKSGGYFTAKIVVERPNRVKVYLKSSECGDWKPA